MGYFVVIVGGAAPDDVLLTRVNSSMSYPVVFNCKINSNETAVLSDTRLSFRIRTIPNTYQSVLFKAGIPDSVEIMYASKNTRMRDATREADRQIAVDELPGDKVPAIRRADDTIIALFPKSDFGGVI